MGAFARLGYRPAVFFRGVLEVADQIDIALGPLLSLVDDDGDELELRIGTLEGATDHDGDPIVPRAVGNHFGTATAPPRPYLEATAKEHWDDWSRGVASLVANGASGREALEIVGELAAVDVQMTIDDWQTPAEQPSNHARKRNPNNRQNDPLVDWGTCATLRLLKLSPRAARGIDGSARSRP